MILQFWHLFKEHENTNSKIYMCLYVRSHIIYNGRDMEAIYLSINR